MYATNVRRVDVVQDGPLLVMNGVITATPLNRRKINGFHWSYT